MYMWNIFDPRAYHSIITFFGQNLLESSFISVAKPFENSHKFITHSGEL